jgi:hypothetical protein
MRFIYKTQTGLGSLGPENGPESLGPEKLLKIVSCQKTVLS